MAQLPIIWFAFTASQLLFAGIGWALWPGPDPSQATTVWALAAMVAPLSVGSVVGAGLLVRGEGPQVAHTRYLIRWAFAESATLMGFVGTFMGGPRWLVAVCAAWGLVLLLLAYPSDAAPLEP